MPGTIEVCVKQDGEIVSEEKDDEKNLIAIIYVIKK